MYFFFFKQKTAYEMRISDWSSDVCSSDLPARPRRPDDRRRRPGGGARRLPPALERQRGGRHRRQRSRGRASDARRPQALPLRAHRVRRPASGGPARVAAGGSKVGAERADRKSVVEGKSVSVRVDLGGRRILKK